MSLDELHERRLATIGNLFNAALDRMGLVLRSSDESRDGGESSQLSAEQTRFVRDKIETIRRRLHAGLRHFSIRLQKPETRQMLAAELSMLWVILENARPERMTGYGSGLAPEDEAEWGNLVDTLLHETEQIRSAVLKAKAPA